MVEFPKSKEKLKDTIELLTDIKEEIHFDNETDQELLRELLEWLNSLN